ncbi:hypothetical protein G5C51_01695 [Streptomyces sp. A7024]|uniref:Integral membrane protein n=1 Tax=Streptomyces coryli TaxID=1128680 RepID=A0A6G4TRH9_9ACTN|nr:hypothetical protein [Streptomyces coryli]NGN62619.1 hypothetical protein [Streptomyces coryli]
MAKGGLIAARGVYGCIVVLALLLALEEHPPPAFEAASLLAATVTGIVLAEGFATAIGQEVERGRPLTRAERAKALTEGAGAFMAAPAPLCFLLLAGFGVLSEERALTLSRWVTLALLFGFCSTAGGLAGRTRKSALLAGAGAAVIGAVLANFKSLTHG